MHRTLKLLQYAGVTICLATLSTGCNRSVVHKDVQATTQVPDLTITWKRFNFPNGNFSVLLPGTPLMSSDTIPTALGPLDASKSVLQTRVNGKVVGFLTNYVEFRPAGSVAKIGAEPFLNQTWDAAWAPRFQPGGGYDLKYKKLTTWKELPALEFQFQKQGSPIVTTSRTILQGDRMYDLTVLCGKTLFEQKLHEQFLDSLEIPQ